MPDLLKYLDLKTIVTNIKKHEEIKSIFCNNNASALYRNKQGAGNIRCSQDTFGAGDIYCSRLVNGYYTAPVYLGPVINSKDGESMPFIAPDESYILFYRVVLQRGYLHISYKGKDGQWMQPIKIDQGEAILP